jgi:hypothetical protein
MQNFDDKKLFKYILNIDENWEKTKAWYNRIDDDKNSNLFPYYIKSINESEKEIFTIKFLLLLKKIFEIEDINSIDKIIIKNYDFDKIIKNIIENKDFILSFLSNNNEIKNHLNYILKFKNYFSLIEKKIRSILIPIFSETYFDDLFKCDDHLTRILCSIGGSIIYIYLNIRDVEETLNIFLKLDITFFQFFIISYMIIDDVMDSNNLDKNIKKIFMSWFMNIVNNPENDVILDENTENIIQCILFEKYFLIFREKYPVYKNINIYNYVKFMIKILYVSNNFQKKEDISYDEILEYTFKKSYVVCFFITLFINIPINYDNNEELCKILFLIQLYDDFFDIYKDIFENNYTYFNLPASINMNFNNRVCRLVRSTFLSIEELNEKNNNVKNIILFIIKNVILLVFHNHYDKLDNDLIDYFYNYSIFSKNCIKYFDRSSYDQFNEKLIIKYIKTIL